MTRTNITQDPLDVVAGKINAYLKKSQDQRVSAAVLLLSAKQRIEADEAGNIDFSTWCKLYIKRADGKGPLSEHEIRRLLNFARAPDPQAAADADREKAREGMRKNRRQKKKAEETEKAEEQEPEAASSRPETQETTANSNDEDPIDHIMVKIEALTIEQFEQFKKRFAEYCGMKEAA
jgi:hypothetical protein